MKTTSKLTCFALTTLLQFATPVHTENKVNNKPTVIVTVSGKQVMLGSETGKNIQDKLQKAQTDATTPLITEETKIRKKEQTLIESKEKFDRDVTEFEKNSKNVSTETLTQKAEEFQDRKVKLEDEKRELDRMVQKLQAEARKVEAKMGEVYQKEMSKFESLLNETIKELATVNDWDIVLMEENLIFSKASKTKEVIEELDKKSKAANQAKKQALVAKDTNKK